MSWDVPGWWAFVLLGLAAYRTWRLIALDSVIDRWRQPVLRRVPEKLHEGIVCPFCFGFYFAVAWWLFWLCSHRWSLVAATPWALSAAVGVFTATFDPE